MIGAKKSPGRPERRRERTDQTVPTSSYEKPGVGDVGDGC